MTVLLQTQCCMDGESSFIKEKNKTTALTVNKQTEANLILLNLMRKTVPETRLDAAKLILNPS